MKHFALRLKDDQLYKDIEKSASEDTRSVNAQINVLIKNALILRNLKN